MCHHTRLFCVGFRYQTQVLYGKRFAHRAFSLAFIDFKMHLHVVHHLVQSTFTPCRRRKIYVSEKVAAEKSPKITKLIILWISPLWLWQTVLESDRIKFKLVLLLADWVRKVCFLNISFHSYGDKTTLEGCLDNQTIYTRLLAVVSSVTMCSCDISVSFLGICEKWSITGPTLELLCHHRQVKMWNVPAYHRAARPNNVDSSTWEF